MLLSKENQRIIPSDPLHEGIAVDGELVDKLTRILSMTTPQVSFLAGDGSDRSYYRVKDAAGVGSAVLMLLSQKDSDLVLANEYDWTHIREDLEIAGLPVPQLLAKLPEHRILVIEDCGDLTLETSLRQSSTPIDKKMAYEKPTDHIAQMLQIQGQPTDVWQTRSFDYEKLHFELMFFYQHYVADFMNEHGIDNASKTLLLDDFNSLARWLASQSKYFTHRDYHSRNILVDKGRWSLIDFQDARIGPASYDLVSLAFDPYVDLEISQRTEIMEQGFLKIKSACSEAIYLDLMESWKPCALQRIIKALGSFAYLTQSKRRGDYLAYAPRAIATLQGLNLQDSRWNFLSGEFLNILTRHIRKTTNYV